MKRSERPFDSFENFIYFCVRWKLFEFILFYLGASVVIDGRSRD
jgi:hypothetical protein